MEKYLKLFNGATQQHLACGEASVLYLASKVAVPEILRFNPQARFIVILRNPVDLVHSLHSQVARNDGETVADFESAWKLQEDRAKGRYIPKSCLEPAILQYRQIGMLGQQMQRLFNCVARDRVKVLLLQDLASDPRGTYENVLAFLGVPSDSRTDFPKENANQVDRSRFLARLVKRPPFPLNILRLQYRTHVGIGTWPARVFARLNRKSVSRVPMSTEFRRELEAEFHDDVRLLERLIDRDLSHWIGRRTDSAQLGRKAG
jgi:hypothetical protein